jgi:ABC-type transport system involved in multi-copper enzyme maturation permease subunit
MNPLIKKEMRVLDSAFLIGCALGLISLLPGKMWGQEFTEFAGLRSTIIFLCCPIITIMVALNSFGAEVSTGTFTLLLAQPVSRLKIWQTKIVMLALALLVLWGVWAFDMYIHYAYTLNLRELQELLGWMVLFVLVVYSGALWTVLLLRQVAAAFWFTLLVPASILMMFLAFDDGDNYDVIQGMVKIALGIYSLAGFFLARWLFMRAQDVQWSGGTIAMPEMQGTPAWLSRLTAWRVTHPRTALWHKEFQLQQSQYILAFVLVILHLGVLATRSLGHFKPNSSTRFILESFWVLWLAMPLVVGCTAVAEERKLGTLAGQLCLPVRRRTQFMVKLEVVLLLSVFFGLVMPVVLEAGRILPEMHWPINTSDTSTYYFVQSSGHSLFWKVILFLSRFWPLLLSTGVVAGLGLISFYISTLSRNTLQSLAPTTGFIIVVGFLMVSTRELSMTPYPLWRGDLIYLIGIPILSLCFMILGYQNFCQLAISWKVWLKNLAALVASLAFIMILTTAIYHRAWETLTPFEPSHGAARFTLSNPARITSWGGGINVRLPDGRIWIGEPTQDSFVHPIDYLFGNLKVSAVKGTYLAGSDWLMVKRAQHELVGIKNDGSLWVSEKPWKPGKTFQTNENNLLHLVKFGSDTDWRSLQPMYPFVLLTKADGTLWRWGPQDFDSKRQTWPGLRAFTPERIGTESYWTELNARDFLQKSDGSVWTTEGYPPMTNSEMRIGNNWVFHPALGKMPGIVRSSASIWWFLEMQVGVLDNGQLNIWATEQTEYDKYKDRYWVWALGDHPIGHNTNWLAAASSQSSLVTLRKDGTLWLWSLKPFVQGGWEDVNTVDGELQNITPTRLGTHSDWIAIDSGQGYIRALAADGSLWYWPIEDSNSYDSNNFQPLLDISQKPQYLGNVFSGDTPDR